MASQQIVKAQTKIARTTIYLVRHAEKEQGNDPPLNTEGKMRAGDLYRRLINKNIQIIYVTQYLRSQMTADSLRISGHIDTVHYIADETGDDLLKKLSPGKDQGKKLLVIGHSNTIPVIIRKLGVKKFAAKPIPENEFDKIFIVTLTGKRAILKIEKYGKPSGKSASMH